MAAFASYRPGSAIPLRPIRPSLFEPAVVNPPPSRDAAHHPLQALPSSPRSSCWRSRQRLARSASARRIPYEIAARVHRASAAMLTAISVAGAALSLISMDVGRDFSPLLYQIRGTIQSAVPHDFFWSFISATVTKSRHAASSNLTATPVAVSRFNGAASTSALRRPSSSNRSPRIASAS
jgi:hypothetical protein